MSDVHTLSGAYALDAIDDVERVAFARHLADCPACVQEVAELSATAARLADAAAVVPPARLRGRVLEEISRTRQVGPLIGRPGRGTPAEPAPANASQPAQPAPVTARQRANRRWRRAGAAVAAAVVLLAAGGGALVEEQRVRDAQRQAAQAAEIEAVLAAPDAVVHSTTGPDGQGRVTLVMSLSRNEAVAVLGGLPSPGVDRTYQLWMMKGTQPTDKGKLGTGVSNGSVLVEGVRDAQKFAITDEPAGGSPAPTTNDPPVSIQLT